MKYTCKICGNEIGEYTYVLHDGMCYSCEERIKEEEQTKKLQSNEETETSYEHDIVCPWCGCRFEDDDGYFVSAGDGEYDCPECGKGFYFQADIEVTYSTQRKEN
nr:MAG TPA: zinc finger and BTB domain-containing protein [Caudoviricetes sp.]